MLPVGMVLLPTYSILGVFSDYSLRDTNMAKDALYVFEARSYTSHDLIILFVAFFKISNLEDF